MQGEPGSRGAGPGEFLGEHTAVEEIGARAAVFLRHRAAQETIVAGGLPDVAADLAVLLPGVVTGHDLGLDESAAPRRGRCRAPRRRGFQRPWPEVPVRLYYPYQHIPREETHDQHRHARRQGSAGHRRRARHRPRHRADDGRSRRPRRRQRPRRRPRRRGRGPPAGDRGRQRDRQVGRRGPGQLRQRRRLRRRRGHGRRGRRRLRAHRHRRQQRRHPARRHFPQDDRGRLGRGSRRPPEGQLQRQPRRGDALFASRAPAASST